MDEVLVKGTDDRVTLLDDLRFLAVREDGTVLHDLGHRVLWACLRDRPDAALVDRLVVRVTPHVVHAREHGAMTPLRRAAQITAARLSLILALLGERSEAGQVRVFDNEAWTADRLMRAANVAAAILDEEIVSAQDAAAHGTQIEAKTEDDDEFDIATVVPDYGNQKDASAVDEADVIDEVATHEDTVLVLPRLPLTTNSEAKRTVEPFASLVGRSPPLMVTPDLTRVRHDLVLMLPHLEAVIDAILNPLAARRSVYVQPTLLVGDPRCGKTTLSQMLMDQLGVPYAVYDGAGHGDAMMLGSSRKWHGAAPGIPLELITQHEVANPGIVIDELEKLGGSAHNGDARLMLLGLFEPRRASSFLDRFLEVPVNYSALNWLATANYTIGIPGLLLIACGF